MIHLYDEALAADLANSIDPSSEASSIVKVMGSEGILPLIAQMEEDKVPFPIICLERGETPIDTRRVNFTAMKRGVPVVFENEENNVYLEKCIPIQLSYGLHILATNTVDLDEFLKEILFKYTAMYYITLQLPYESNRKIRFGVTIDDSDSIKRESASLDYITGGKLYEAIVPLRCEGAVMLSYTPKHIERFRYDSTEAE